MKAQFLLLPLVAGANTLVNISAISSISPAVSSKGTTITFNKYEIDITTPFDQMCTILQNHTIPAIAIN